MFKKDFNGVDKEALIPKDQDKGAVQMTELPKKQKPAPKKVESNIPETSISAVFKFAFPILWKRASGCVRFQLFCAFFSLVLSTVFNATGPICLKYAVDTLTMDQGSTAAPVPTTLGQLSAEKAGDMIDSFTDKAGSLPWYD